MADFPVSAAAKTGGTWEIPGSISNGLFVVFAPLEEPEILVAVVVERGGGGGGLRRRTYCPCGVGCLFSSRSPPEM